MTKYIVITGGSLSGLGKGTLASNLGILFQEHGYNVTSVKIDPYLNIDAGTISPSEHGEVYVLNDGHEGDLDLGNYERALGLTLSRDHNITSGKVYNRVLADERNGAYLGATVQMVPHVSNLIQKWIYEVSSKPVTPDNSIPDICVIEVGGTVGDIESSIYLEAFHQFFNNLPAEDRVLCHLTFVPIIGEEQKTKLAQHSFRSLRNAGLFADFIFCRSPKYLAPNVATKIALFGGVTTERVYSMADVNCAYDILSMIRDQDVSKYILDKLNLPIRKENQSEFVSSIKTSEIYSLFSERFTKMKGKAPNFKIAFVVKYVDATDTYLSIIKSVEYAKLALNVNVELKWVKSTDLEETNEDRNTYDIAWDDLKSANAILVPGGFGQRGTEGKLAALKYGRENNIPTLGICLGMQLMCVEAVRNCLGKPDAGSEEFGVSGSNRVIVYMPETIDQVLGGTMRLGGRRTILSQGDSLARRLYGNVDSVMERHRHRYEFNFDYEADLLRHGYMLTGKDETMTRLEIIEYTKNDFYIGVQYHPELLSRPSKPHPLFIGFVEAAAGGRLKG